MDGVGRNVRHGLTDAERVDEQMTSRLLANRSARNFGPLQREGHWAVGKILGGEQPEEYRTGALVEQGERGIRRVYLLKVTG